MSKFIFFFFVFFSFQSFGQFIPIKGQYVLTPENNTISFWHVKDNKLQYKAPHYDIYYVTIDGIDYLHLDKGRAHYGLIGVFGEEKCNDLKVPKNAFLKVKKKAPNKFEDSMYYFRHTNAKKTLLKAKYSHLPVQENKCYVISSVNGFDKTIGVFRVKKHVKGKKVIIDQAEVYQKITYPPHRNPGRPLN